MTPAEELREAARRMRGLAQFVHHFTAPWRTCPPDENGEWSVACNTDHPLAGLLARTPDYGTDLLPDYIASWPPPVALAVAGWLDSAAELGKTLEAQGASVHAESHALKVARAYLGESTDRNEARDA